MTQTCKNITFPATSFAGGNRYITVHNNLEKLLFVYFHGKKTVKTLPALIGKISFGML